MERADSTLKQVQNKVKNLVSKLAKDARIKAAGIGFTAGITLDTFLYGLAHKVPKLAESTGVYVPGYAEAGIHLDDVIGQSIAGVILLDGIRRKSPKQILASIAAAIGEVYVSQTQYGPL